MSDRDVDHDICVQCNEKKELLLNGYCQECTYQMKKLSWEEEYWDRMREMDCRGEL